MRRSLEALVSSSAAVGLCVLAAFASMSACTTQDAATHDAGDATSDGGVSSGGDIDAPTFPAATSSSDGAVVNPVDLERAGDAAPSTEDDAGPPVTSDGALCHVEWPQPDGLSIGHMQTAMDGAGNTYVAINYGSSAADAGPPPLLSVGTASPQYPLGFAVAKFDDACHLVWIREFGAADASGSSAAESVAIQTDAQSNVTILGWFNGTVDLGAGSPAGPQIQNGFLLRLDPSAKTLFSTRFTNTGPDSLSERDLAVTPAGISTIAVSADSTTDFGNGPGLANPLSSSTYDLVQFDANGKVLFRETDPATGSDLDEIDNILKLATNSSGFLWATGGEWSGLAAASVSRVQALTMGITSSGTYASWVQDDDTYNLVAAGAGGAVQLGTSDKAPSPNETLQAFSSTGASAWTVTTAVTASVYSTEQMVIDGSGAPVVGGLFQGTLTLGSAPTLMSAGGQDLQYQTFDTTGHLRSQGRWGGPDDETFGGIGVDPAGNIFMAGRTAPLASSNASSPRSLSTSLRHPMREITEQPDRSRPPARAC